MREFIKKNKIAVIIVNTNFTTFEDSSRSSLMFFKKALYSSC